MPTLEPISPLRRHLTGQRLTQSRRNDEDGRVSHSAYDCVEDPNRLPGFFLPFPMADPQEPTVTVQLCPRELLGVGEKVGHAQSRSRLGARVQDDADFR
jgi:hypothetical protein